METPELSIILPCRNEEQALPTCLKQIKKVISQHKINAEIIVSDSSTDKSPEIARQYNVKLIKHNKKGYGIAYLEAFKQAKGKYIFMADADCTYDFNEIPNFLKYLKQDYDFVIGNRFAYNLEKNTMPLTHKYIGNPILSGILRLFFSAKVNDSHCGMRAITRKALDKLHLQTTGMEFASEMVIKVVKNKTNPNQIPPKKRRLKTKPLHRCMETLKIYVTLLPFMAFFHPWIVLFPSGHN